MAQAVRPVDTTAERSSHKEHQTAQSRDRCSHSSISWPLIGRITGLGILCIICLLSWVRLIELQAEGGRLDRMIDAEKTYQGQLSQQRRELCNIKELKQAAPRLGLVEASAEPRRVRVGCLSAPLDSRDNEKASERQMASADHNPTGGKPSSAPSPPPSQTVMVDHDILQ